MRTTFHGFALSVVAPAVTILWSPRPVAPQNACVANPKISAPTTISPRSGDIINPTNVIQLTGDGGSSPGGSVNFRWSGSFKSGERFVLEITAVSTMARAIAPDAPTTTTSVSTSEPIRITTSTTPLDASTRLIGAATGTSVYTTAAGVRQHSVNLERGKSYRWRIRAYNCGSDAPFSAYTSFSVEAGEVTFNSVAPAITSLSPWSARAGQESALTLAVNGSNFTSGAIVRWNGADRATTFVSPTRVTATIPASDLAVPSTAQITVSTQATDGGVIVLTAAGSGGVSNPKSFQVLP